MTFLPNPKEFKTIKEAEEYIGGLSKPSKMPGYAFGFSAEKCNIGSRLRERSPGSVCAGCYARKGRYVMGTVRNAHETRYGRLFAPRWVDAFVFLLTKKGVDFFRWHDSGDLQGETHLRNIVRIAERCPETRFWLPTKEYALIRKYLLAHGSFPPNLTVRVSAPMVDGDPPKGFATTSTVVHTRGTPTCPAPSQGGECKACRACWDPQVANVAYKRH